MTLYRFSVGEQFHWRETTFRVVRIRPGSMIEIECIETDSPLIINVTELLVEYAAGRLSFLPHPATALGRERIRQDGVSVRDFQSYPDHIIKIADRRYEIIKPFLGMSPQERNTALRRLGGKGSPHRQGNSIEPLPSRATICRWIKAYNRSGGSKLALIPNFSKRGGANTSRLEQIVDNMIKTVIDEIYMVRENVTVSDVYLEVARRIQEENVFRPQDKQLSIPSQTTIWRRIRDIDEYEHYVAKHGKRAAKRHFSQYSKSEHAELPLGAIEIDHTVLDVIVIEDDSRPVLTVAVDNRTRVVVGYCVGFEPPSYLTVMECLYHAILPKVDTRQRYKTRNPWLGHGCPTILVTDNGKEFIGRDLTDSCESLGIVLMQLPPMTPHYKGTVERFFRTLNQGLIHKLPGTTLSNVKKRGDYDSLKRAALDFDSLEKLITTFIVDVYNQRPHKALGTTPAQAWEANTKVGFNPRLPENPKALQILLGRVAERTVQPYGIEFNNWLYNTDRLARLRDKLHSGQKVRIKYHPGDIGCIYVLDPFEDEYIEVPVVPNQGYVPGMSLWKRNILQKLASQGVPLPNLTDLAEANRTLREIARSARKDAKLTKRRAARLGNITPSLRSDAPGEPTGSIAANENATDEITLPKLVKGYEITGIEDHDGPN